MLMVQAQSLGEKLFSFKKYANIRDCFVVSSKLDDKFSFKTQT